MIAIHNQPGSSFSDSWIKYCRNNNVSHKEVNCYSSDILSKLDGCCGLMWHLSHKDHRVFLMSSNLIYLLENKGMKVFPSYNTCWHYDDKIAQKYLLESINAPLAPTYIFYDRDSAIEWAKNTKYPKVFKLRRGAGSENVQLIHNAKTALRLIDVAFGRGFSVKNRQFILKDRLWQFKRDKNITALLSVSKGLARLVIPTNIELEFPREKGYAYFQDFISGNDSDIRVVVIGKRAFAIKRMARKGDFRASGSGKIIYEPSIIPENCLKIAFSIAAKLKSQSIAFDFVFEGEEPRLLEISYTFTSAAYSRCLGYWTDKLKWIEGYFKPGEFMIEDFIKECNGEA